MKQSNAAIVLALAVLAGWGAACKRGGTSPTRAIQFVVNPPTGVPLDDDIAEIAPDGSALAFSAGSQWYLRRLDWVKAAPIVAMKSEGIGSVAWSPDSRAMAYARRGDLIRLRILEGVPEFVRGVAVAGSRGASWGSKGVVLVARPPAMVAIPIEGGQPVQLDLPADAESPCFLPDGEHFLFFRPKSGVYAARLANGRAEAPVLLKQSKAPARWAIGRLYFLQGDNLYAQVYRPGQAALEGTPELIATGVRPGFSVSADGVVAYRSEAGLTVLVR